MRNAIQDDSPKPALRKRAARGNQYEAVEMAEVNDLISTRRIMRTRKTECAMSFNLWTVQGTWFWSLVYPDRHGGAIGAAASEAEAVGEAQAAIKRLPQLLDDTPLAPPRDDSRFIRRFQRSGMRTMGKSYNNLWRLTLRRYAARVDAA